MLSMQHNQEKLFTFGEGQISKYLDQDTNYLRHYQNIRKTHFKKFSEFPNHQEIDSPPKNAKNRYGNGHTISHQKKDLMETKNIQNPKKYRFELGENQQNKIIKANKQRTSKCSLPDVFRQIGIHYQRKQNKQRIMSARPSRNNFMRQHETLEGSRIDQRMYRRNSASQISPMVQIERKMVYLLKDAFQIPSMPQFNIPDNQHPMIVSSINDNETSTFLDSKKFKRSHLISAPAKRNQNQNINLQSSREIPNDPYITFGSKQNISGIHKSLQKKLNKNSIKGSNIFQINRKISKKCENKQKDVVHSKIAKEIKSLKKLYS